MVPIVFFSTSLAVASELEGRTPTGITLSRLKPFGSEVESFDFFYVHFVANIDLSRISTKGAIDYLLSECSRAAGKHYFELNGRRFSTDDTVSIHAEAEKLPDIDQLELST